MIHRKELKQEARGILKNAQVSVYLFTLLFLVITLVLSLLSGLFTGTLASDLEKIFTDLGIPFTFHLPSFFELPEVACTFIALIVGMISTVLAQGYTLYHLGIHEKRTMPYATLFDGFTFAGKIILLDILTTVLITLWSFLLVLPGLVAAYRYSLAVYNLCENPDIGVMEALRMSKKQTRGYKWSLFVLDLSFIGWYILSALTMGLLNIWLEPYVMQTRVCCFQFIKRATGIGCLPPAEDDTFHPWDPSL